MGTASNRWYWTNQILNEPFDKNSIKKKIPNETVSLSPLIFEDCEDIRKSLSWANKFQMKSLSKIPSHKVDLIELKTIGVHFLIAQQLAEDWPHKVNECV